MTSTAREPRDSELLRIELGVIWRLDGLGRLPGPEDLVIGVAADGMVAAVASVVPDPLAGRLLSLVADGGELPDVVVGCQALLGGMGVAVSRGPSYLVEPPLGYDAGVEVLTSAVPAHARLVRPLRPGNWEPGEWDDLLGGREGAPWAMIVEDGQVAAVCHTARLTPAGAEAGTWTAPAYRGRGYAAATTAAWSGLLPDTRLFYSTSADNRSSQRVAERLGLRPIGHLWKLTA
ncbi:hypothetical protein GCM10022224_074780 [Nonomuraea antimicrobica]|uniref:N-acetyltransferase domain-containing protein n=1 Tax=Nonomuraea antimicrobica TaxID=561173 RepID=A0ABP7D2H4_9ACTN